jgi:hypothetical protein
LRVVIVGFFILFTGNESAFAGAWTPLKNSLHVISTTEMTFASFLFDDEGNKVAAPRLRRLESALHVDYGVTDWLSISGKTTFEKTDISAPVVSSYTGVGYTELGARARFWQGTQGVASIQSSVRLPGASDALNPAEAGHTQSEWDLRALSGYHFSLRGWQGFAEAQAAYRFRFGDPADEVRLDLTLGVRPYRKVMFMAQSFNTLSVGEALNGYTQLQEYKMQVSSVWDVSPCMSLQMGARTTLAGRNIWQEQTYFGGVWTKF